jgi:hypothetical protein
MYLFSKGMAVGKSSDETIDPPNELMVGQSLGEFENVRNSGILEVLAALQKKGGGEALKIDNKKGTVLDSDVKSGR